MTQVYGETEHQELCYAAKDLREPIHVHIPSALGQLGYYVFLRLDRRFSDQLGGLVTRLKVGGLRPEDVTLKYGEGFTGPANYASKSPGLVWVAVARAMLSRGEGQLTLANVPAGLDKADVLVCTWPRFVASGQADDHFAIQVDPNWALGGVALGGIGCGKVEFCRDGRFRNFSGNNNQDMPFEQPDGLDGAYLSIEIDGHERVLATRPVTTPASEPNSVRALPPVAAMTVDLCFPQVTVTAINAAPQVDVRATLSGMMIPHDLKLSSLPGFVVRWTVQNRSSQSVRVMPRLAWPNLVGEGGGIGAAESRTGYGDGFYRYWTAPDSPAATVVQGAGWQGLEYSNDPSEVCNSADGHHVIAVAAGAGETVFDTHATRGWAGAELTVAAGQTAQVDMAVAWDMPHWLDTQNVDRGHYWQNYAKDGRELMTAIMQNFQAIIDGGSAMQQLLDATDLPAWLRKRLSNSCYPLVTNSVLYKDGRFSINEGPTEMAGTYGTMDQRLGAYPATFLLFPELNRMEMELFSRIQSENGGVNHDLGAGHLEAMPFDNPWPDIPASFLLQWAMHCWTHGDADLDRTCYARCAKALTRIGLWADQGHGVPQISTTISNGQPLGTSYDGYHYTGTMAYVATLWMAALQTMRKWARKYDDSDLSARIETWLKAAHERLEADLWNGRFYRAYASAGGPTNENSHAGMIAGEYYARMLTGEDVLAADRLEPCCQALLSLNGNSKFRIPPDEVSADLATFTEYGWLPYVESFCLAPLAVTGHQEMWKVWQDVIEAMDRGGKSPCDTRLMYQPLSGEQSWGSYYMTAPASWLVYQAALDFVYWRSDKTLRLSPTIEGKFAVVHPLFWAVGEKLGGKISLTVQKVWTKQPVEVETIEVPVGKSVTINDKALTQSAQAGVYAQFTLPAPVTLKEGTHMEWQVK